MGGKFESTSHNKRDEVDGEQERGKASSVGRDKAQQHHNSKVQLSKPVISKVKEAKKPSLTPKDKQSNSTVLEGNRKSHEDTLSQLVSSVQPVETAREIVDHMEEDVEEKESLSLLHQWTLIIGRRIPQIWVVEVKCQVVCRRRMVLRIETRA